MKIEFQLTKSSNKVDFINVQYAELDELYATMDDPAPSYTNSFKPNSMIDFAARSSVSLTSGICRFKSTMMELLYDVETSVYKSFPYNH